MMKATGTAKYIDLEMGFWGIIAEDGKKYRPVNMPEQLKYDGARVKCTFEKVEDEASFSMWGIPVKVTGFETISV